MRQPLYFLIIFYITLLPFSFGACDSGTTNADDIVFPSSSVSYAQHVQPLFNLRCSTFGCHDDQTRAGNLRLTSYIALTERPGIVVPGNSTSSLLIQRIDGRLPHPVNIPIIINQNQLDGMKKWIDEGAKNN
jgi:hypothetical protein